MWNPIDADELDAAAAADFWPPRANGVWRKLLSPVRRFYLRKFYAVADVDLVGPERLAVVRDGDGVLLTPNHSHDGDPHVMMDVAKRLRRQFYFMAAWQLFKGRKGVDGFVLQRMGAFSVDREGCDRQAIRQAVELLTTGKWLVVFPEGEIYRTNDRLTPLREGVAFMAGTAQKALAEQGGGRKVWLVPTAIRYRYLQDVTPRLEAAMDALEERVLLKPGRGRPLHERIVRFGETLLTIKEKEQTGRAGHGDLPARIRALIDAMLGRLEAKWLARPAPPGASIAERVKGLRQQLIERWMCAEGGGETERAAARDALADVQIVMQVYSYPGDYVAERPTVERMAETIEKFEEDVVGGVVRPKGKRAATVVVGEPIDVSAHRNGQRPRAAAAALTATLQAAIAAQMREAAAAAAAG
jgi:1-acyl-sn-glycerol-3-phosphate acyltransferase